MAEIRWQRYPRAAELGVARTWLALQANLGLAANTLDAYARALEEYLAFSAAKDVPVVTATKDHIGAYVRDLTSRPNPRGANVLVLDSGAGLANATLQQRITAVRLFYDYLMEEGQRSTNPVGRGRYAIWMSPSTRRARLSPNRSIKSSVNRSAYGRRSDQTSRPPLTERQERSSIFYSRIAAGALESPTSTRRWFRSCATGPVSRPRTLAARSPVTARGRRSRHNCTTRRSRCRSLNSNAGSGTNGQTRHNITWTSAPRSWRNRSVMLAISSATCGPSRF